MRPNYFYGTRGDSHSRFLQLEEERAWRVPPVAEMSIVRSIA